MTDGEITEKKKNSGCGKFFAFGCLALVLLCIIAGVTVFLQWRNIAGYMATESIDVVLTSLEYPAEEKEGLLESMTLLTEHFNESEASLDDMQHVVMELQKDPVCAAIIANGGQYAYVAPSGLSDLDKKAAETVVNRYCQGLLDGVIDPSHASELQEIVIVTNIDENNRRSYEPKKHLTDEDVRACIRIMEEEANRVNIGNEYVDLELPDRLKDVVKRVTEAEEE